MRTGYVQWAALAAAVLAASAAGEAGEVKGSRWAGPEAFVYVESSRPEVLLDRLTGDRVSALVARHPSFRKVMERPDVKVGRGIVDFVARGFGTSWDKGLRDLAGGGIVAVAEGKTGPERVFVVITPKDRALLEKVLGRVVELSRADAKFKGRPDPVAESEHGGIKMISFTATEAHAFLDDALVVANGVDTLKVVIDRAARPSPGLADDPAFQGRKKEADPEALAWSFVRLDRLRAIDPKTFGGADSKPDAGSIFVFGPWLEAARKGDWATIGLTWTEQSLSAEVAVADPKGGKSPALARFFPAATEGAWRPIGVPNLIASTTLWRDLEAIWEVRGDILPPEAVQGLAQLDGTAGTFFGGRDFGTGVLGALGPHWTFVVADQEFAPGEPAPDVKLPAFALVLELKPDDEEFATRMMAAFQSFIGLANLGAAQTKAPPLMLGSEVRDGVTISTSKYQPESGREEGDPVHSRHNYSPSAARVGRSFVVSSSLGLARDLVDSLQKPASATGSVLLTEMDGPALARLAAKNRAYLVTRNMLEKGNAKDQAEGEVASLIDLLTYLGRGSLRVDRRDDASVLKLRYALDAK